MAILNVLIGVGLLFFGRRAYWLFVAAAGFLAGLSLANRLFEGPDWFGLVVGLGIGLLAALIAVAVQRFAFGLAGFLVGGYIALQALPLLNLEGGWATVLAFFIGGVIGVILVGVFLGWALISLSSLAGAALIVDGLSLEAGLGTVVFIILVVVGVVFQARELQGGRGNVRRRSR